MPKQLVRPVDLGLFVHFVRLRLYEKFNALVQVSLDWLVANHLVESLLHQSLHPAARCASHMTLVDDLEQISFF